MVNCPTSAYGGNAKWIKYVDPKTCAPVVSKSQVKNPNTGKLVTVYTINVAGKMGLAISSTPKGAQVKLTGQNVGGAVTIGAAAPTSNNVVTTKQVLASWGSDVASAKIVMMI